MIAPLVYAVTTLAWRRYQGQEITASDAFTVALLVAVAQAWAWLREMFRTPVAHPQLPVQPAEEHSHAP